MRWISQWFSQSLRYVGIDFTVKGYAEIVEDFFAGILAKMLDKGIER